MAGRHQLTAGKDGRRHSNALRLLPAPAALRAKMLPPHDFRDEGMAEAIEKCPFVARFQLTHGLPLTAAITSDYIPVYSAVLMKLQLIPMLEERGERARAQKERARLIEMLRNYKGYRQKLAELFEEYANRTKPGKAEIDCHAAQRFLFDENPGAQALERLAAQIRDTVSPSGIIDFCRLRELILAQVMIFECVQGSDPQRKYIEGVFAPFLH